ncbi:MAG: sugar phosphate isomerase/epimerase family protein [Phycisphaerae bacterium]
MKRRNFLKGGAALVAAPAVTVTSARWARAETAPSHPPEKMKRVGATTVCFRSRFPQTRPKNAKPAEPDLTLEAVPAMFARDLGVHNVEIWSRHFAETSAAYCQRLKTAAEKAGSRIINVQLDSPGYDLSQADAAERAKSIQFVKDWMDRAAACGATSLRANTGGRGPFDVNVTGDAFAQLAEHGKSVGVRILVENHGGHSGSPDNIVAIMKHVGSPWCGTLPDFGNMPGNFTQEQRAAYLKRLFPHAYLVSAKGMDFDAEGRHTSFDIGACVRVGEACGFKGIYSAEQWSPGPIPVSDLAATQRIIAEIVAAIY